MIRLLFFLFGKRIHRHIANGLLRPEGFTGMQHAFTGLDGKAYWTWMDLTDMPPVRKKHIERCLRMADAGIGEKTLDELCTMIETYIMEGVKAGSNDIRNKALAKATQIVWELRRRPTDILPEEVWYDLCAIFAVREDEDARAFDPAIHQEKLLMLSSAGRAGHDFFTGLPELRKVLGSLLTTETAYIELLSAWAAQRVRMEAVRSVLQS